MPGATAVPGEHPALAKAGTSLVADEALTGPVVAFDPDATVDVLVVVAPAIELPQAVLTATTASATAPQTIRLVAPTWLIPDHPLPLSTSGPLHV